MKHPADAVLVALITVGLAADVPLIRNGHASVSERAGATFARRALVVYFAAHFVRRPRFLYRLDPLSALARRIRT